MQPRHHSFIEACMNTLTGFFVTLFAQEIIYPIVGLRTTGHQNFVLALFFTALSIIRSYLWRRLFNRMSKQ